MSGKISHRAWFSPDEYKQLYQATRERAQEAEARTDTNGRAEQLHDYVLFMANTGLRPDEAWTASISRRDDRRRRRTGETILEIEVRGKRGVGYCKSMPGAVRRSSACKRLRQAVASDENGKETIKASPSRPTCFPKRHHELFNTILEELKLKMDRDGQPRTAYSLRHTYICLRLMEGRRHLSDREELPHQRRDDREISTPPTSRTRSMRPRSTFASRKPKPNGDDEPAQSADHREAKTITISCE